jgi:hypothetical protein
MTYTVQTIRLEDGSREVIMLRNDEIYLTKKLEELVAPGKAKTLTVCNTEIFREAMSVFTDLLEELDHNDGKVCFEVYYTDKQGKEGKKKVWVNNVDEVDYYFSLRYPLLELNDIGEC